MSKKHFIALANMIREKRHAFNDKAIMALADFCKLQNPQFNHSRWIRYIKGECGPNGGTVK